MSSAATGVTLAPVALRPTVAIAGALVVVAVVFLVGGTLNVDTFLLLQRATVVLPDTFWAMVTICGTGVVAFALLSPTLAWQPRWYAAALGAGIIAGIYSNGLKHLFGMSRPMGVLDPSQVHLIGETLRANSFPSGHSITAFTLAALLVFGSSRPLRTAAWTVPLACLVALSRIAVGAHWPADIACGAAGGWVSGALGVVIATRWRIWNTEAGVRLMASSAIGVGISLFLVDLGYPLAWPLQIAAGVVAIGSGLAALRRPRLDGLLPYPVRAA